MNSSATADFLTLARGQVSCRRLGVDSRGLRQSEDGRSDPNRKDAWLESKT